MVPRPGTGVLTEDDVSLTTSTGERTILRPSRSIRFVFLGIVICSLAFSGHLIQDVPAAQSPKPNGYKGIPIKPNILPGYLNTLRQRGYFTHDRKVKWNHGAVIVNQRYPIRSPPTPEKIRKPDRPKNHTKDLFNKKSNVIVWKTSVETNIRQKIIAKPKDTYPPFVTVVSRNNDSINNRLVRWNVSHLDVISARNKNGHNVNKTCVELRKLAFVKTHKTGGTTVLNVIQRFGHVRNLVFALPKSGNYLGFGETVSPFRVLPPPRGKTYDLLINHVMYNKHAFGRLMPKETIYVTIIRHPLSHFVSAIEYLKNSVDYIKKLPRMNRAGEFLNHPEAYETKDYKWSFTNNRMSFDLGLDRRFYHNEAKVDQFIQDLAADFKLVMITEHMDESLLLLKRYLCWTMKDVLYIPRNVNKNKTRYNFTSTQIQSHKQWDSADYKLYHFFHRQFWERVKSEGESFNNELEVFQAILAVVKDHCIFVNKTGSNQSITIEETKFNPTFTVEKTDCVYMLLEEVPFLLRTRKQQLDNLRRLGQSWGYRTPVRRRGARNRQLQQEMRRRNIGYGYRRGRPVVQKRRKMQP